MLGDSRRIGKVFGRNLRILRTIRGISIAEMAALMDVPRSFIDSVENGITDIDLGMIERLSQIIGVEFTALFIDYEEIFHIKHHKYNDISADDLNIDVEISRILFNIKDQSIKLYILGLLREITRHRGP